MSPSFLLLVLAAFSSAAHAIPDRVATHIEGESVTDLRVYESGGLAAWIAGGSLVVLDTDTWESISVDPRCLSPAGVAFFEGDNATSSRLYTGCSDGTVSEMLVTDGSAELLGSIEVGTDPVAGLIADESNIYVVLEVTNGLEVHTWSPVDSVLDDGGFACTTARGGFEAVDQSANHLVILHGSDDVSKVDKSTGGYTSNQENLGSRNWIDVTTDGNSGVFLADSGGAVARFVLSTNEYNLVLLESDGLVAVDAIALSPEAVEPYLALAEGDEGAIWFLEYGTDALTVDDTPVATVSVGDVSALAASSEFLYAGLSTGGVDILTELPWVEMAATTTGVLVEGDTAIVRIQSDQSGDWAVYLGAADGDLLTEGSLDAEAVVEVELEVDDGWVEGTNRVFVLVESAGLVGHDAVDFSVDNPPSALDLADDAVGFGAGEIVLRFDGVSDEDLDRYDVYVSTVAFSESDYADGGGPEYEGVATELEFPVGLEAAPGESVDAYLGPLENGQQYYVSIRAVDSAGQEGPMSRVFKVTPTDVVGAAELAGQAGGCGCASQGSVPGGFAGLGLAFMVLMRRSRKASMLLLALLLAPVAQAAEKSTDLEVRLGPTVLSDDNIEAVYGEKGFASFLVESGRQWFRVVEVDAGFGVIRGKGDAVGEIGGETVSSGYPARLVMMPLSISTTLRLDLLENQPVVPYVRGGSEYWLWFEQVNEGSGYLQGGRGAGGMAGWHYGAGLNILLDVFSKERAGTMLARWGVHDSYLVVDWRTQEMLGENPLGFGGTLLSVGLKLDK